MIKFSFKQLQVFVNTVKYDSLSKAAQACFISQAAASKSLIHLEAALDMSLFDRIGKRLYLNSNGQQLLPMAVSILNQAEALPFEIGHSDVLKGNLNIGASTTVANYVLPQILSSFKQQYPEVNIELFIDNSTLIVERMLQLELDVGFIEGDVEANNLLCSRWRDDELFIVASSSHPLAQKKVVSIDDLKQFSWVFREPGSGTRMMFYKAVNGDEPFNCEITLNNTEAILNYLKYSHCLSYVSKTVYQNSLNEYQVKALSVEGFEAKRHFFQLLHPDKFHSRVCHRFLQILHISDRG